MAQDAAAVPAPASVQEPGNVGDSGNVKSLAKGLRALEMLLDGADLGTVELSRILCVDKGAASRILKTLATAGFAAQDASRRYRAGPKLRRARVSATAPIANGSIRERARPLLEQLHRVTAETSHLAVRADDQVLYLDKVDSSLPLRVDRPIGTLSPLHCTALGKVFLAFGEAPLPRTLSSFTSRTPVTLDDLRAQFRRIVEIGFARDDEEFALGIRCVAAPLREPTTGVVVAAIGISGPTARIPLERLDSLGELVKQVAIEFPA
jgi:DNA-binding IclR family transcriptional regulator